MAQSQRAFFSSGKSWRPRAGKRVTVAPIIRTPFLYQPRKFKRVPLPFIPKRPTDVRASVYLPPKGFLAWSLLGTVMR